ncbi:MAG: hypothetical protein ABR527_02960 [Gemmatimonadota bacterium]
MVVSVMLLMALTYLTGSEQAVSGAGAGFALTMASIAAYAVGDGVQVWGMALALLALLIVSYVTRPASRRFDPIANQLAKH